MRRCSFPSKDRLFRHLHILKQVTVISYKIAALDKTHRFLSPANTTVLGTAGRILNRFASVLCSCYVRCRRKSMSNQKFRQFQSYTLPLAGVLMVVGSISLFIG
jgi:hypothetical protein